MKRDDILLLIAIWEFITGACALAGAVFLGVLAFPETAEYGACCAGGAIFGLSAAVLVLLAFAGLAAASGVGLLMGREWGRICAIVHAAVSLVRVPFGTAIGVLVLVYLTRPGTRDHFRPAAASDTAKGDPQ